MTYIHCSPGTKISPEQIPLAWSCCSGKGQNTSPAGALCPLCRKEGMHIENITVRHLLKKEMEGKAGQEDYWLCMNERCAAVYYNDKTVKDVPQFTTMTRQAPYLIRMILMYLYGSRMMPIPGMHVTAAGLRMRMSPGP